MFTIIFIGILSLLLALILGQKLIPFLVRLKFGQTVREDGPQTHLQKNGTPTMGGFIFIIPTVVLSIASLAIFKFDDKDKINLFIAVISMILFGLVGFIDDYIKVIKKQSLGLRAKEKIVLQVVFSFIISILVFVVNSGEVYVPIFAKYVNLGILYIPFSMFVMIAIVNSVNLTDGLDGLATSVTLVICAILFILSSKILGSLGVDVFLVILMGSLLGFLKYNRFRASVFMGDTGSMALGGAITAIVAIMKIEAIVPILCFVFFTESLSVIIQVLYFKKTGKRFFKMAPIHHHFEKLGYDEVKVVRLFVVVTLIMGIIGYYNIMG